MDGRVIDSQTHEPLYGASVYYRNDAGQTIGVSTDEDGAFSLAGATGRQVFVSFVGFELFAFTGVPGSVTVPLESVTLDEADIYGERPSPWPWVGLLGAALVVSAIVRN